MEKFRILRDENNDNGGGGAPEPETPPAPEPAPEAALEPTPEQTRIAELEAENTKLKVQAAPVAVPAAPQPVTSAMLESYTDEQWATIEARTGKDKSAIIRDFKDFEITNRQNTVDAKTNTAEALQDALESNPKLLKLRGSIREFMDDIPVTDKLDPVKLKRAMEKAIIYAKGKYISMTLDKPSEALKRGHGTPSPKAGAEDEGGDEELLDGEIKNDEYVAANGLRITTGKISKEDWKKVQHKHRDPNGVRIPVDYDKPPVFK